MEKEFEKEKKLRLAYLYMRRGELRKAWDLCDKLVKDYGEDGEVLEMMGDVKFLEKDYVEAAIIYRKALELAPGAKNLEGKLAMARKRAEEEDRRAPEYVPPLERITDATTLHLPENIEAMLCYLFHIFYLGWLASLLIFFLEKKSLYVRFHALQSFLLGICVAVITVVFYALSKITSYAVGLFWIFQLLVLVIWAIALFNSVKGEEFKLPIIGDLAERWVGD
ncbi:MAG: DUF4870 domain-containing protein [bacterium]